MNRAEQVQQFLQKQGINTRHIAYQWSTAHLIEYAIRHEQAQLAECGALVVDTGKFTGRSPKDRYIVYDKVSEKLVNWGEINIPIEEEKFLALKNALAEYLCSLPVVFVRDAWVGAHPKYRIGVRFVNELAWQNLFVKHLMRTPSPDHLSHFDPEWLVMTAPHFTAPHSTLDRGTFVIISFAHKTVIIGGTAYAGEIKKSIFTVMNFILPTFYNVLPMHCAANVGKGGDTALFFGLSGTGKTTLSSDPERRLVGDDEHGWAKDGIFNFEGGCYAKTINLDPKKEPLIYNAIRFGTVVENVKFYPDSREINFRDRSKTENTRAAYPLDYLGREHIVEGGVADHPSNIFFLTYDAFGVLPPVARLTPLQAELFFLLGYTSKVAGTEIGITEPQTTFSTCFGAPFMPLNPYTYTTLLKEKITTHSTQVWLINTGMIEGPYGTGRRIPIEYTRAIIRSATSGKLRTLPCETLPILNLTIPVHCPDVPDSILNPLKCQPRHQYEQRAKKLLEKFAEKLETFKNILPPHQFSTLKDTLHAPATTT